MTDQNRNDEHPGLTVNEWRRAKLILRLLDHSVSQLQRFHSCVKDIEHSARCLNEDIQRTIERIESNADDLLGVCSAHGLDPLAKPEADESRNVGPDEKPIDF